MRTTHRNRPFSFYMRYMAHYFREKSVILILGLVTVVSINIGASFLSSLDSQTVDNILKLVSGSVASRQSQSFWSVFSNTLLPSLALLLLLFFCGFCAIAQPIIFLVPAFKGLGYGLLTGTFFATYGTRAMGYVALIMLPGMLLSSIAVIFACRESLRLSNQSYRLLVANGEREHPIGISQYSVKFICFAVLMCVASLLEAVFTVFFAAKFALA